MSPRLVLGTAPRKLVTSVSTVSRDRKGAASVEPGGRSLAVAANPVARRGTGFQGAALGLALALPCALALGCGNPALDVKIEALGGEVPGVEPSEYHRPGQPCLDCHGPYKGASPELAIGGTIFAIPAKGDDDAFTPVEGVEVTLTDAFRVTKTAKTNCIGNFYITKEDWDPGFPLQAKIDCGNGTVPRYMSTRISRAGSCAECHSGKQDQGSPGWVYCVNEAKSPFKGPGKDCPGVP